MIHVSTPSRLCLFGEHQDYLNLEVFALAIDLRFFATITPRCDDIFHIAIRDKRIARLCQKNQHHLYENYFIHAHQPITYENKRDYLKSSIRILLRQRYPIDHGFDITMNSDIPIGKGMCSSSSMIVALIKAILEGIGHPDKDNPAKIAHLAFLAEVAEFGEPGGMMDHYTSAMGGLVHLDFADGITTASTVDVNIPGCFILFDSLTQKDTTGVLTSAKVPTLQALEQLSSYGINSVADFLQDPRKIDLLSKLDETLRRKLAANIDNYRILKQAKQLFESKTVDPILLGQLLYKHHTNLRDGLNLSTPIIEKIMNTALAHGALGGKINGSGGGGCLFVYAHEKDAAGIIDQVEKIGYPGKILTADTGVRIDKEE